MKMQNDSYGKAISKKEKVKRLILCKGQIFGEDACLE